jgi:uncharacterized protein with HEPN domain
MRSDRERILDILEAIDKIKKYSIRGRTAFDTDELLQSWVVRNLQIIGEAANRISQNLQDEYPQIPWKKIIGMRHILVHGYFEIDLEVVWSVIENDLEELDVKFSQTGMDLGLK